MEPARPDQVGTLLGPSPASGLALTFLLGTQRIAKRRHRASPVADMSSARHSGGDSGRHSGGRTFAFREQLGATGLHREGESLRALITLPRNRLTVGKSGRLFPLSHMKATFSRSALENCHDE